MCRGVFTAMMGTKETTSNNTVKMIDFKIPEYTTTN